MVRQLHPATSSRSHFLFAGGFHELEDLQCGYGKTTYFCFSGSTNPALAPQGPTPFVHLFVRGCNENWTNLLSKRWDTMQRSEVQHNARQHNTMRWNAMQFDAMQHAWIQYSLMQRNAERSDVVQCYATRVNAKQFSAIQCTPIHCNGRKGNAIRSKASQCNAMPCIPKQCT